MRKYFCDICGRAILDGQQQEVDSSTPLAAICPQVKDICPKCARAGKGLMSKLGDIVLTAWRNELPKPASNPAPPVQTVLSTEKPRKPDTVPSADSPSDPPAIPKRRRGRPPKSSYAQAAVPKEPAPKKRGRRKKNEEAPASTADDTPPREPPAPSVPSAAKQEASFREKDEVVPAPAADAAPYQEPPVSSAQEATSHWTTSKDWNTQKEVPRASPASTGNIQKERPRSFSLSKGRVDPQESEWGYDQKHATLARIKKFRAEHGLGCLSTLAKEANLSIDKIRDLLDAIPQRDEIWDRVSKALDTLGV